MRPLFYSLGAFAIIILLTSCGGGGGGGGGGGVVKPPAPEELIAKRVWVKSGTDLTQKTDLTWKAVNGAQSYNIYRKAENQTSKTFLGSVSSTSYTDNNIPRDSYIYDLEYFVTAVVNGVEGDEAKADADAPPPPSPF